MKLEFRFVMIKKKEKERKRKSFHMIDKHKRKCRMKHRTDRQTEASTRARTYIHSLVIESCRHTSLSRKNRFLMSMCSRATRNYINTREKKTSRLVD